MILDLTVRRLRQIVAAIHRRQFIERRERITLNSWATRQTVTFISAGFMTDKGKNPALDAAQVLAFDLIEEAQIEEARERSNNGGNLVWGKDETGKSTVLEIVPDLSKVRSSFDVMNAFGDPSKWRSKG